LATQGITADQFSDIINGNDIVLVDFWASWCRPCLSFAPTFAAASEQHPDVVFAKVDTEAQQELAAAAQIRSIPTLMVFKNGKPELCRRRHLNSSSNRSNSSTSTPPRPLEIPLTAHNGPAARSIQLMQP
jgi:thioredoxin